MSDSVAVVWDDALLGYTMGGDHPLHPVRLDLTMRLADSLGVLASDRLEVLRPTPADVDLLTLVHDPAYLEAVRRAPSASRAWIAASMASCCSSTSSHRVPCARVVVG